MICGYEALGWHGDVDPVASAPRFSWDLPPAYGNLSGGHQDKPWDRSWDLGIYIPSGKRLHNYGKSPF